LGGSGEDSGFGIAVDAAGNAYVVGLADSSNFPTTAGAFQPTRGGGRANAFVTKLNPTGTALVYSTYLGGSGNSGFGIHDQGLGIAVDTAGNAYVTGFAGSSDFPTTAGAFQPTFGGGFNNAFVTKLNPTGTGLVYSTYLGGNASDQGLGIAVDTAGNAYVAGATSSINFPTTAGAFQPTGGGFADAFVTKLNPTGTGLVYSTFLGGNTNNDFGSGIAVDTAGNAYVTGFARSSNFPTTAGAFQPTFGGGFVDAFVTKLDATGSALLYSTYLGGSSNDVGQGIAVDGAGSAYVTGETSSTNFPTTPGAAQTIHAGGFGPDAFVTKLDATGSTLLYSTYLGGSSNDVGRGIAVDGAGSAYVTGNTFSTDFPTTSVATQTTNAGGFDVFVTKLDATGSALLYSTYLGGSGGIFGGADIGNGIAVDSAGSVYVTGSTDSTNFPTTSGAAQTTHAGFNDAFVAKIVLPPTSTDQCKNDGWQNFGGLFKNQGDCVSFVSTKGKNSP
jgi:hypothetical protein